MSMASNNEHCEICGGVDLMRTSQYQVASLLYKHCGINVHRNIVCCTTCKDILTTWDTFSTYLRELLSPEFQIFDLKSRFKIDAKNKVTTEDYSQRMVEIKDPTNSFFPSTDEFNQSPMKYEQQSQRIPVPIYKTADTQPIYNETPRQEISIETEIIAPIYKTADTQPIDNETPRQEISIETEIIAPIYKTADTQPIDNETPRQEISIVTEITTSSANTMSVDSGISSEINIKTELLSSDSNEEADNSNEINLQCIICHKMYSNHYGLRLHSKTKHKYILDDNLFPSFLLETGKYKCKYCYQRFETKLEIRAHVKKHKKRDDFKQINAKVMLERIESENHFKRINGIYVCNICLKCHGEKYEIIQHIKDTHDNILKRKITT